MKYLQDYMAEKQTELFKQTGTIFAFSTAQFQEQKKDNIKYVSLGAGMICPKENAKTLVDGLDKIYKDSIKQDIEENGKENIIIRELYNHECFYTRDYQDAVEKLEAYGFTSEEIKTVYYKELPNSEG